MFYILFIYIDRSFNSKLAKLWFYWRNILRDFYMISWEILSTPNDFMRSKWCGRMRAEAWALMSFDLEANKDGCRTFTVESKIVQLGQRIKMVFIKHIPYHPKSSAAIIQNPITNPEKIRIATTSIICRLNPFIYIW